MVGCGRLSANRLHHDLTLHPIRPVNSSLVQGSDIHDVSGNGGLRASATVSHPLRQIQTTHIPATGDPAQLAASLASRC